MCFCFITRIKKQLFAKNKKTAKKIIFTPRITYILIYRLKHKSLIHVLARLRIYILNAN